MPGPTGTQPPLETRGLYRSDQRPIRKPTGHVDREPIQRYQRPRKPFGERNHEPRGNPGEKPLHPFPKPQRRLRLVDLVAGRICRRALGPANALCFPDDSPDGFVFHQTRRLQRPDLDHGFGIRTQHRGHLRGVGHGRYPAIWFGRLEQHGQQHRF